MPNHVEDMMRHKLFDAVMKYLRTISPAAGYNTRPAVFEDHRLAMNCKDAFVIEVDDDSEGPVDDYVGGKVFWEYEIAIVGWIRPGDDSPRRARNKLIQDVRTAIGDNRAAIASAVGRGLVVSLGRSETDKGVFLDEGLTGFEQVIVFKHIQGSTW